MINKVIIGCFLCGASFFLACNQLTENITQDESVTEKKELEMYKDSELALLMRKMYKDNLEIRDSLIEGFVPRSFPKDFSTIHTAKATEPEKLDETFQSLADLYLQNMTIITEAKTAEEAKISFNGMINTCSSCHTIYCPGPLSKIKKMKIPIEN